ncbi:flagellar biosynthesis protein FlgA [Actinomyces sp. 2119]|uniref:Flagellar biosynthesis protein FlgA n=1 Tax=Actinomyces lilanjuaniae TaxID=2321394 RepID=A0ABN5PQ17_9ACTO|nr:MULTISPECIES: SAF domain-containing protein [Actinomyces]AYD90447.1 flagellar biosynthesis protein FlgA [Actinomyces lilanjuaniae]RJF40405.1 flagellar biosynthesis protein FlgA [Actinomyces sp. 2119]
MIAGRRTRQARSSSPRSPRPQPRTRARRPSLLLWRHRHLVVAACLAAAAVATLNVLRPDPPSTQEVLVAARQVSAGTVVTKDDVVRRSVPAQGLPESGLAGEEVVGQRSAITLEPGTVLTTSMTSAALTQGLDPDQRVVQVPVGVGAELAEPGAQVDVIDARGDATSSTQAAENPSEDAPSVLSSPVPLQGAESTVLTRRARVLMTQPGDDSTPWGPGTKVTLVTIAVSSGDATLVAAAATTGALGIVLSP